MSQHNQTFMPAPYQYGANNYPQVKPMGKIKSTILGGLAGAAGYNPAQYLDQVQRSRQIDSMMPYQTKMLNLKMAALEREGAQQRERDVIIQGMPEEERQMAIAGGESYWENKFSPSSGKPFSVAEGASVYDPKTGTYSQPQGIIGGQDDGKLLGKSNFLKEYTGGDWTNDSFAEAYAAGGDTSLLERREGEAIPLTSSEKMKIGRDLTSDYKETRASINFLNKLDALTSSKGNTPFDDIAATFTIMKALDPRSVVRESEFDLLSKAGGYIDKMNAIMNSAQGKGYITDYMKQSLRNTARKLRDVADEDQKRIRKDQVKLTGSVKGGTSDLIPDLYDLPELKEMYDSKINPADELERNIENLSGGGAGTPEPTIEEQAEEIYREWKAGQS